MKFSFDSIAHLYKNVYYNMPQSLKTFLGTLYGSIPIEKRYGSLYTRYMEIFKKFEEGNQGYQEEYLYHKTLETLLFAQENIPFYQKRFADHGVSVSDFKSLDDLKKFPTMTKEDIKNHVEEMYSENVEKAVAYFSGGSTSSPTKFYHPLFTSRAKHKAYSVYTLSKCGYRLRDRALLLKGRETVDLKKDTYWDYEPVENFLNITSSYILSDKFPLIYQKSKAFKPKFFFGYPSAVMDFMYATKSAGLAPLKVRGIILASENIHESDILELKSFYGDIPVFVDYGHTERVVGAWKVDFPPYRFVGAYGISRIVNGEIVGTSLDNMVMPYINYKTGDEVDGEIIYYEGTDIAKSAEKIKGRVQDYLVTYDHRLIPLTTLYVGHHLPSRVVHHLQYQQSQPGKVTVLIQKGVSEMHKAEILKGLYAMVKEGIKFEIRFVEKIAKSSRGKRVVCKQMLDIEAIKKSQGKRISHVLKKENRDRKDSVLH